MLSASAVLRAALTGSFLDLDDESLDLQMLVLWKIVELFLFSSVFAVAGSYSGSWYLENILFAKLFLVLFPYSRVLF